MGRNEFIGKLNALYVGDKNCLEELITTYDEKNKTIERKNKVIHELLSRIATLEYEVERLNNNHKKATEYIEKYCVYDEHLQGYCMGLSTGEVKTLVKKMGGRNE